VVKQCPNTYCFRIRDHFSLGVPALLAEAHLNGSAGNTADICVNNWKLPGLPVNSTPG
jgi:hypothetical protein